LLGTLLQSDGVVTKDEFEANAPMTRQLPAADLARHPEFFAQGNTSRATAEGKAKYDVEAFKILKQLERGEISEPMARTMLERKASELYQTGTVKPG
jgi:hypothetical protein